eukprot:397020-Amphidinium_carterae.1
MLHGPHWTKSSCPRSALATWCCRYFQTLPPSTFHAIMAGAGHGPHTGQHAQEFDCGASRSELHQSTTGIDHICYHILSPVSGNMSTFES